MELKPPKAPLNWRGKRLLNILQRSYGDGEFKTYTFNPDGGKYWSVRIIDGQKRHAGIHSWSTFLALERRGLVYWLRWRKGANIWTLKKPDEIRIRPGRIRSAKRAERKKAYYNPSRIQLLLQELPDDL